MENRCFDQRGIGFFIETVPESDPVFQGMNVIQSLGLRYAEEVLLFACVNRVLERRHFGKVLDFGCASGGPTYSLVYNGADVVGVDKHNYSDRIIKSGILAPDKFVVGDGIDYMRRLEEGSLDMVTAFMFGPFFNDFAFIRNFYSAAQRVINPEGRIVICSDAGTMDTVLNLYGSRGVKLFSTQGGLVLSKSGTLHTESIAPIVIPKEILPVKDYSFILPEFERPSYKGLDLGRYIK